MRSPRRNLPLDRLRDRVLFGTIYVCGARAGEVCGLHVADLDLRVDDKHVRINGKCGLRADGAAGRPWLCGAAQAVPATHQVHGGPLSYDAAQHHCRLACLDIRYLRHSHATELINAGVSIETVRRRLGHADRDDPVVRPARGQGRRRRNPCRGPCGSAISSRPAVKIPTLRLAVASGVLDLKSL